MAAAAILQLLATGRAIAQAGLPSPSRMNVTLDSLEHVALTAPNLEDRARAALSISDAMLERLHTIGAVRDVEPRAYLDTLANHSFAPPNVRELTKDTMLTFGLVHRDLTGDGAPETVSLIGRGPRIDSLGVTFEIRSPDRVLYRITWPMTRMVRPERNQRLSDAELRTHLREYGGWFFEQSKFMTPDGFVAMLRDNARLHIAEIPQLIARQRQNQRLADSLDLSEANAIWQEMQSAGVTVFQFSTGGDAVWAIAWSPRDKRFYRVFECC